jgi:hypothetical protein
MTRLVILKLYFVFVGLAFCQQGFCDSVEQLSDSEIREEVDSAMEVLDSTGHWPTNRFALPKWLSESTESECIWIYGCVLFNLRKQDYGKVTRQKLVEEITPALTDPSRKVYSDVERGLISLRPDDFNERVFRRICG